MSKHDDYLPNVGFYRGRQGGGASGPFRSRAVARRKSWLSTSTPSSSPQVQIADRHRHSAPPYRSRQQRRSDNRTPGGGKSHEFGSSAKLSRSVANPGLTTCVGSPARI